MTQIGHTCWNTPIPQWLTVGALGYAAILLVLFWRKTFRASDGELTTAGKVNIIIWTVGPPIWFFIEYYYLSHSGCSAEDLKDVKTWQDLATKFWAGVLAAMIFLKGK